MTPDIVYVVRRGEQNPELRYSLRSLVNVPHRRVWIFGHKPKWVANVEHVATIQRGRKWENSTGNVLAACDHPDVTPEFVLMNDDFFVMRPLDAVPVLHRGPVRGVLREYAGRGSTYTRGMAATTQLLASWGYDHPLSYELHMPMPVNREAMADVLRRAAGSKIVALHKRTLYGNVHRVGGQRVRDCKVLGTNWDPAAPFLSSSDSTFRGRFEEWIRAQFPDPSPYEVPHAAPPRRPGRVVARSVAARQAARAARAAQDAPVAPQ